MSQLDNIEAIQKRLWSSADTLRANSNYASNQYFLPVMGLIFLRHAYSRYLAVKDDIIAGLPVRGGERRELTPEDFSRKGAIFLRPQAEFDYLVNLPEGEDRSQAVIDAMDSIEADYPMLAGVLPKSEYQELDGDVLGQILRTFNDPALRNASGDIFGRIYEYFLTQFADQGAHDNGEFFTPVSLVQMIVNVIEPEHGQILDPACGSAGMFVQSAHFIEAMQANPTERVTFYGMEKNQITIRLALMNLAVHGLEGNIQKAISYYDDPHGLLGQADFVMANPPFNVDEVDAKKVENDPRLPFGLPGVNKQGKVSNGNYLWISYFYSYLNQQGRAGFVMSSQASSAGRDEAKVRQKLVESGAVDVMMAIRSNFFYTRTVPCELWFLDRAKATNPAQAARRGSVLMLDARHIFRQVTRKIYDFSPEQQANLTSIVWLYRGQSQRFVALVESYLERTAQAGADATALLSALGDAADDLDRQWQPFLATQPAGGVHPVAHTGAYESWQAARTDFWREAQATIEAAATAGESWQRAARENAGLHSAAESLAPLAEQGRILVRDADALVKAAVGLLDLCEGPLAARKSDLWPTREINNARKALEVARLEVTSHLKDKVRYFYRQAHWLQERFPDAELRDVPGLCKRADVAEIAANDWSLTPGRYVGVAPEEVDDDFDFEETLREIHIELDSLNAEAVDLAAVIQENLEELWI